MKVDTSDSSASATSACAECPFKPRPQTQSEKARRREDEQVCVAVLDAYNTAMAERDASYRPVRQNDLTGPGRSARIALVRQMVAYTLIKRHERSLPHIGKLLGGRNHSTIWHGRNHIEELLVDPEKGQFISGIIADALERLQSPATS